MGTKITLFTQRVFYTHETNTISFMLTGFVYDVRISSLLVQSYREFFELELWCVTAVFITSP